MMNGFDKQKLYDGYAAALSKAWECYIRIIDLLLGLSGATALVFIASVKIADWHSLPNRGLIIYVFILSALAIICGLCWRFSSQHFMEYETLGASDVADLYFKTAGIKSVTTSHQASHSLRSFYRLCFRIIPIPMGIFLLSAWVIIFLVFFGGSSVASAMVATPTIARTIISKPVTAPPVEQESIMFFSDNALRNTTVIYNLTIALMSFGVFLTWHRGRREKSAQEKQDFLSCTARYIKIQEMIINTDRLSDLNLSIYQSIQGKPFDEVVFSKELAVSGMMFQLMEDVWLMHGLERCENDPLLAGWHSLFSDWMKAERIAQKWTLLKAHFSKDFVAYVDRRYGRH